MLQICIFHGLCALPCDISGRFPIGDVLVPFFKLGPLVFSEFCQYNTWTYTYDTNFGSEGLYLQAPFDWLCYEYDVPSVLSCSYSC